MAEQEQRGRGRPRKKNNAEYFPHYTTMRNHKKVKALRAKFGAVLGYAFWSMFLEILSEQDGLEWHYTEFETEMLAAEIGTDAETVKAMLDYCLKLELLFLDEINFIRSDSLNEVLQPLFDKRNREREVSATKKRKVSGQFYKTHTLAEAEKEVISATVIPISAAENTTTVEYSAPEIPQSKVEEIKEEESKADKSIKIEQTGFVETENFGENGKDIEVDLRGVDSTGNKKNNKPRPNVLGSDSDSEVLGVLSATQEPHKSKEVYNAVKKDWLAFYSDNFKEEYYFVSTDGAKIKSLLRKIRRKMVDKSGAEPTGDELIRSTAYYVSECLKTANSFISGNFNLSILDSKFNELFILIKNANGAKQGTISGNGAANRGNGYNGTGGLTPQQRANALYDK